MKYVTWRCQSVAHVAARLVSARSRDLADWPPSDPHTPTRGYIRGIIRLFLSTKHKLVQLCVSDCQKAVTWVEFSPFFVCFSDDMSKTDAAGITKLDMRMFHDESWKPIYVEVNCDRLFGDNSCCLFVLRFPPLLYSFSVVIFLAHAKRFIWCCSVLYIQRLADGDQRNCCECLPHMCHVITPILSWGEPLAFFQMYNL